MSKQTEALDKFFNSTEEVFSNCCNAKVFGELFKNFGRCGKCYEMAEFKKGEDLK